MQAGDRFVLHRDEETSVWSIDFYRAGEFQLSSTPTVRTPNITGFERVGPATNFERAVKGMIVEMQELKLAPHCTGMSWDPNHNVPDSKWGPYIVKLVNDIVTERTRNTAREMLNETYVNLIHARIGSIRGVIVHIHDARHL